MVYTAAMNCAVCDLRPAEAGHLCEECRDEIAGPLGLVPEQIVAVAAQPTAARLIDPWGRPHILDASSVIGRHLDTSGVSVLEGSVSRHHAAVTLDPTAHTWTVKDLGSANGTRLNDQLLTEAAPIRSGDRIGIGPVAFYFVAEGRHLRPIDLDPSAGSTLRPSERVPPPGGPSEEFEQEQTDVGLPSFAIRLHEPTGGGGGMVEVDNRQVQLTATQFEFFALLVKRMASEGHQPDLVRGFVRTSELIADLSWDTRDPGDNHVKQLVRRVRRALVKAEIGDLIESRHRFGYRLRVIPKLG